jgi:general secretion pathway protein C
MLQRYFWLARLLLVTLLAILAADIAKSYISAKMAAPPAQRPPQASGTPNRPAQMAAADYQVIFNANPPKESPGAEPPPPAAPPPPTLPTQLQLKLIGTVAGTSGRRFVIIEDLSKRGVQAVYQIGDSIQSAVITEINPMCVLLERGNGPHESLCFQQDGEIKSDTRAAARPSSAAPPPPATSRNTNEGIVQVDPGTWRLSRELLMEQLSNFANLSTQAQFMPYTVQGQPQGTRITRLTPGSMLQKIGLQTGDILQKMNGISMNSPEEALRAFQQLQSEATVRLDVLRQNRATTLTYELR